jgi:CRISP-associated protein Cas1
MLDCLDEFLAFNNFLLAWQKVADKQGCAGADGETIQRFRRRAIDNIQILCSTVANGQYQPYPYQQVLIPKGQGGQRALSIPTVRDRVVQQALLNVLNPIVDPQLARVSFAYRPQVSYLLAVEAVAQSREEGYLWVLDGDIVKYFDNIDREILLQKLSCYVAVPEILGLVRAWIAGGVLTKAGLLFPDRGIPQGAVISPLLANIYLNDFDLVIDGAAGLRLVRYGDDFVVLAKTRAEIEEAYGQVRRLLGELKLTLHDRKTQVTTFERGFRFLGHGFLGEAVFPIDQAKPSSQGGGLGELSGLPELLVEEAEDEAEELMAPAKTQVWNRPMATLYLLEQGTSLYRDYQRLIVHVPGQQRLEIPLREIERILVFGNIQISTPVVNACMEAAIGIFYLSRSGKYRGHLWSAEQMTMHTERMQLERQRESGFQLAVCQALMLGKLTNSRILLQRANRKRKSERVAAAIAGLSQDLLAVERAANVDQLRGYEGNGAARYFGGYGDLITNEGFEFHGRNRQPPMDAVNSLLSFGYTLLFNNVLSLILVEGLAPFLGNFHYGEDKKPYLAFDLMEEFRSPIVDSLVLTLVNQQVFRQEDFEISGANGGVYLAAESRKVFLQYFERRMNQPVAHPDLLEPVSYRYAIQLQVRRYRRAVVDGVLYEPFVRAV